MRVGQQGERARLGLDADSAKRVQAAGTSQDLPSHPAQPGTLAWQGTGGMGETTQWAQAMALLCSWPSHGPLATSTHPHAPQG